MFVIYSFRIHYRRLQLKGTDCVKIILTFNLATHHILVLTELTIAGYSA